jgi:hypothetical protein
MLFGHDLTQELSFSLGWQESRPVEFRDVVSNRKFSGRDLAFEARISAQGKEAERPVCRDFLYTLKRPDADGKLLDLLKAGMGPHAERPEKYDLTCEGFELVRQRGRPYGLPAPLHFFGFPDEASVYWQNATTLQEFPFTLRKRLNRLFYLGPLRRHPERQYAWAGETPEQVGFTGENWVGALLAARQRQMNAGKGRRKEGFEALIARWLKDLGLIHSFKVEPIHGTRDYRVQVQVSEFSAPVSIPDVGFGVSQILPVLVECFYAPPDSTIIIEQPELHLHPAVQQGLADLFVEVIHSREDGKERGIQLVIESHSEHFLRRLQLRVADQTVRREDVSAYFCAPGQEALVLSKLDVDLYGNITNWPKDFFGDQMTDVAEMQKAGIQRRRAGEGAAT